MPFRRAIFDWFICLSLLNLLLLRIWAQLLPAVVNRANLYYMEQAPDRVHYPAVLLTLFSVSGLAAVFATWARRGSLAWPRSAARAGLILVFVAALNSVRAQLPAEAQDAFRAALGPAGIGAVVAVLLALLFWLVRFHNARLIAAIEVFAIFALPFLLMTVGQAVWTWSRYEPDQFAGGILRDAEPILRLPARRPDSPRVVWVIFDELDQRAAFDSRPAGLALPELERLAAQSLFAANAYAPAGETRRSLASMLLGLQIGWAMPDGAATLPCSLEEVPAAAAIRECWSVHENIFEKVRKSGVNVGVAGWYHPYCRIFMDSLSHCTWAGLPYWDSPSLRDSFEQQWEEVLDPIPVLGVSSGPGARVRRAHLEAFMKIRAGALQIAADPSIGFALLHLPVPHHPDIYDPVGGRVSVVDRRSYLDNLVLADRTLGEIRSAMEAARLWETSTVVVTSDHWWRAIHRGDWGLTPEEEELYGDGSNRRVPFIAKFAGENAPVVYRKAFNTLLLHDLVLEIVTERLATTTDARAWLDANRLRAPIPYPVPAAGRRGTGSSAP